MVTWWKSSRLVDHQLSAASAHGRVTAKLVKMTNSLTEQYMDDVIAYHQWIYDAIGLAF